jgi:carboxyl-terminal processing protease
LKDVDAAVKLLRGEPQSTVNVEVVRKGVDRPISFSIKRELITFVQVKGELIKDQEKTYALIENRRFNEGNMLAMRTKYFELLKRANGKLSGLIITLENNPGGLLNEVYNGIDLFLDAPSFVLIRNNDGIEMYSPPSVALVKTPGDITKRLPILVVVNGGSASASEVFAAAMKHFGRAVIAGTSRTFGKGVVQTIHPIFKLNGNDAIKLTSAEYLIGSLTDWTPVQCIGVESDILFEYPGINNRPRPRECEYSEHVNTGGPMVNGPIHRLIKEVKPELYKAGELMLEAYKAYKLPKLLAEEEKRKQLEAQ